MKKKGKLLLNDEGNVNRFDIVIIMRNNISNQYMTLVTGMNYPLQCLDSDRSSLK